MLRCTCRHRRFGSIAHGATGCARGFHPLHVAAGALGAGDGALLRPGAAATLRNAGDGPLVVLVATILPADGAPAP